MSTQETFIWVYFQEDIYESEVQVNHTALRALVRGLRSIVPTGLQPSLSYPPNKYKLFTFPAPIWISRNLEETLEACRSTDLIEVPGNRALDELGYDYSSSYIYFAIQAPAATRRCYAEADPHLLQCLQVCVKNLKSWEYLDVTRSGGVWYDEIITQGVRDELNRITQLLEGKRHYEPGACEERELAQNFKDTFDECYTVDHRNEANHYFPAIGPSEFRAFYNIGKNFPEYVGFYTQDPSSLKTGPFTVYFTHRPFISAQKARGNLRYRQGSKWGFPLLVSRENDEREYKFIPRSDFDLIHHTIFAECPLILGEVISDPNETDRWRVLVEAIAAARVGKFMMKEDAALPCSFFVVAIYLTEDFKAERYILLPKGQIVYIHCRTRDLTERHEAQLFLHEMFNVASIALELEKHFYDSKFNQLNMAKEYADPLPALITTIKNKSANVADEPTETDDNVSVFQRSEIRSAIRELGKNIRPILSLEVNVASDGRKELVPQMPDIAMLMNCDNMDLVGYLKFILTGLDELEILRYLAAIDDERNHTIRPIRWWPTDGGVVLYTPNAGKALTQLEDPGMHLQSVARQLFEAVAFMHLKGVAHLDLKPDNIMIPEVGGRLVIIDFSVSVRVSGVDDMFGDEVGTDGFMAPEVGMKPYSAIRADLWSCGKVMQEFCSGCPASHFRDWLLDVCQQLMHEIPNQRPTMDQVLNWLDSELSVSGVGGAEQSTSYPPNLSPQ